jgi:hypothetical protein
MSYMGQMIAMIFDDNRSLHNPNPYPNPYPNSYPNRYPNPNPNLLSIEVRLKARVEVVKELIRDLSLSWFFKVSDNSEELSTGMMLFRGILGLGLRRSNPVPIFMSMSNPISKLVRVRVRVKDRVVRVWLRAGLELREKLVLGLLRCNSGPNPIAKSNPRKTPLE